MQEETLKLILEETRKEARFSRLAAAFTGGILVVLLIAIAVLIPRAVSLMTQIGQTAEDAQQVIAQAGETIDSLSVTIRGVETMTESFTKTSAALFDGVEAVDFFALAEAVTNLREATQPLVEFSRMLTGR